MQKEEIAKLLSANYFDATSTIRHYDTLRAGFSSISVSGLALLSGFAAAEVKGGGDRDQLFPRIVTRCVVLESLSVSREINFAVGIVAIPLSAQTNRSCSGVLVLSKLAPIIQPP